MPSIDELGRDRIAPEHLKRMKNAKIPRRRKKRGGKSRKQKRS